jgi:hypothetical protein
MLLEKKTLLSFHASLLMVLEMSPDLFKLRDNHVIFEKVNMNRRNQGTKAEVIFYEGYKGRESPRAVLIGNKEFKIDKIIWQKRTKDLRSGEILEVFNCRIEERHVKITIYESGRTEVAFEA